jgi:hypothetical protein
MVETVRGETVGLRNVNPATVAQIFAVLVNGDHPHLCGTRSVHSQLTSKAQARGADDVARD